MALESIVAWKSTCILTKVTSSTVQWSSLPCVIVGGVHHCLLSVVVVHRRALSSVLSGGRPSPCVVVSPQWWPSITVRRCRSSVVVVHRCASSAVLGGGHPSPSVVIGGRLRFASSSVAIHRHLSSVIVVRW